MRLFSLVKDGDTVIIELNWLALPTFIGMNELLRRELGDHLEKSCKSITTQQLTEKSLDALDTVAITFFQSKFPGISGLSNYLDAMKYMEMNTEKKNEVNSGKGGAEEESGD